MISERNEKGQIIQIYDVDRMQKLMEFTTQKDIKLLREYLYKGSRFHLERKYSKLT